MNWKKCRKTSLTLMVLFAFLTFMGFQTQPADALVPSIVSITHWTSGTHTILNITITHVGSPTPIGPSHYVSVVQVDFLNGTIRDLNQLIPQSTTTFVVQYDIGEVSGTVSVRARAFCNYPGHGWSSWSNTVVVPEYSFYSLIFIFAVVTILLVAAKFIIDDSKKKVR